MTERAGPRIGSSLDGLEPIFLSISETSRITSDSTWRVKELLRLGIYEARKSGRRTLVSFESIRKRCNALPVAVFAPPRGSLKSGTKKASMSSPEAADSP
jgi:hypothetical protein